ncbi:XshC-Cox1 family protein [Nocardia sp. SYP-A9097]|uniref:XdhC family protein n=1 Tax=Nocardia sp. SYP-A9097 TaxID=2663237 RepID=UPI00129B2ADB|nr:XdhC/CoxI family protein [Nocardia sp. SYP-A9097]MRH92688.1 XshC-Cox1 family protein [Nocardia sp. SYP-A9097]
MRDVLPQLIDRVREGPVALARVVAITGGGPREVGAAMVVTGAGEVLGSLSGGCVESAVVEAAGMVLTEGEAVLERYGIADPDGFAIGLTCGGEMEVCIERVDTDRLAELEMLAADIRAGRSVSLVTTLTGSPSWQLVRTGEAAIDTGSTAQISGGADIGDDASISRDALHMARAGRTGTIGSDECGDSAFPTRSFVQSFGPPARMILAGANDFVRALSRLGAQLGYRVTVVDARETFATATRFPAAHEVVVDWPHRYLRGEYEHGRIDNRTVVCVLTHDTKFDVPMLAEALRIEEIGFVGAMGSRRTHADRVERLTAAGVAPEQLRRLRSPLGLDLNASTPDETAVSIAAQLIAEAGRASGRPLDETDGPIHR